jgi:hypothetical protein
MSFVVDVELPATFDSHGRRIDVGTFVRSFDFEFHDEEGPSACFVEGEVLGVERESFDCPRYVLRPTRRIFAGEEIEVPDEFVFPPLNGTPTWLGGITCGVEVVDHVP